MVLYLPWLPSLKADIDSPTTDILSVLSPFHLEWIRDPRPLEHRVPVRRYRSPAAFAVRASLGDLPGPLAMLLLVVSIGVGVGGVVTMRSRLGEWFAAHGRHLGLIVAARPGDPGRHRPAERGGRQRLQDPQPGRLLAVPRPRGGGADHRRPTCRPVVAAALAVTAFALGAVAMAGSNFQRPPSKHPGPSSPTNIPEASSSTEPAFTPRPLTNFDIEVRGRPRLTVPEQASTPFVVGEGAARPGGRRRAGGRGRGWWAHHRGLLRPPAPEVTEQVIEHLPSDYELTETVRMAGIFELQALVYERTGGG